MGRWNDAADERDDEADVDPDSDQLQDSGNEEDFCIRCPYFVHLILEESERCRLCVHWWEGLT
jgi:hypothetical protein